VRFEDVRFGYDPDREIARLSLSRSRRAATVAIVGPSGAGKSTIARLLFRFYDVQGGRITIDGQDMRDRSPRTSLRAPDRHGAAGHGAVQRHHRLQHRLRPRRRGPQAEIEAAARGGGRSRFIVSLPKGYRHRVGERGLKLSGGEKQRVAIARTSSRSRRS
jgi:ABC-type transport system involved in Fe-S cluster assembly fused permease/ATPase subunit